ncbi:hypothetical protein [Flavobacterium sp.]|uniref:hypothetical protein n=1 Tax=Flavobacterium sp. TaxID=239 RepID=UPI00248808EA|nr:hypothetical protein [Flavobacterium sp.]MDI1315727.1 hypothetical protein [Flavobacterium sp.]
MKAVYAFLFFLLFSFTGFSQFESPKRTLNIAPVSSPKGNVAPTSSKSITYPSIFDKKDKLLSGVSLLKKEEEERSIFEKEQFASPVQEYTDKMNKQLKSEGYTRENVSSDMYLGDFKLFTEKLSIACRDNSAIDGDQVCIWLNGERAVPVVTLEGRFKTYNFMLKKGLNDVQIEALNVGESFPNTGQFSFFDGNGKLITTQNWDLNTGYKAIMKINRMDGIREKE